MRKLDNKNKAYIFSLLSLTLIIFILIVIFISYQIRQMNIKYEIKASSYVYNVNSELKYIESDTYAKKNLFNKYYIIGEDEKINIGNSALVFNDKSKEITLLGTFYEIGKSGNVNKIKGYTQINSTAIARVLKIDDRKYAIIAPNIRSNDGSLNVQNYLLINIDKAGNAYLYNKDVNIKTFKELSLITDSFTFNVNEELLLIENETIDLAKVIGSTNEYVAKTEIENSDDNNNENVQGNGGSNNTGSNIFVDHQTEIQTVTVNQYVARKTTIISTYATVNSLTINYLAYDPFSEYTSLYVEIYNGNLLVTKENLDVNATSKVINNLSANTEYRLDFYYTYEDENNIESIQKFDSSYVKTDMVTAKINLEMVSDSVVRYILKVDDNFVCDSATVSLLVEGQKIASEQINPSTAASTAGYHGSFNFSSASYSGQFAIIRLENCLYNGANIDIEASYKYKI